MPPSSPMNRKGLLLAALVMFTATGAFAQATTGGQATTSDPFPFKLSVGVGAYFTSDFGGGYVQRLSLVTYREKYPYEGGGGYVFFDMTYAEFALGFFTADGARQMYANNSNTLAYNYSARYVGYDISLLGKWPYVVDERLTLFALMGINYRGITFADIKATIIPQPDAFSALWFKMGLGLDYAITPRLFTRISMAYGLRPFSEHETLGGNIKVLHTEGGLDFKLAAGWRF